MSILSFSSAGYLYMNAPFESISTLQLISFLFICIFDTFFIVPAISKQNLRVRSKKPQLNKICIKRFVKVKLTQNKGAYQQ